MFQSSVLKSFSQDESLVALRWSQFQKYLAKVEYIKTVKEEKYQDGFLKDVFENCLGYTLDMTNPSDFNLEREKKNETDGRKDFKWWNSSCIKFRQYKTYKKGV